MYHTPIGMIFPSYTFFLDRTLNILWCILYLVNHLPDLLLFVGNVAETSILAELKSIQYHTCIKFKETKSNALDTPTGKTFAVVFSNSGHRYLLFITLKCV